MEIKVIQMLVLAVSPQYIYIYIYRERERERERDLYENVYRSFLKRSLKQSEYIVFT